MGTRNEQMFEKIEQADKTKIIPPPITARKGSKKMERTYVLNAVFKIMAAAGIVAILGIAGASDLGSLSLAELFIYGGMAFAFAAIGIWGAMNCTRAIEAMKRRQRREIARRVAAAYHTGFAA